MKAFKHRKRIREMKKRITDESSASVHFPITHFLTPEVFETRSGMLGVVIRLEGVDVDTATSETLNALKSSKHRAILQLPTEIGIYEYVIKQKLSCELAGQFQDEFSHSLDASYHQQFKQGGVYRHCLYLVLFQKGPDIAKGKLSIRQHKRNLSEKILQARKASRELFLTSFLDIVNQFCAMMNEFTPTILGRNKDSSDAMNFFSIFLGGIQKSNFSSCDGVQLNQPIASLCAKGRLFFGNSIEWFYHHDSRRYGAVISLKQYPSTTSPVMWDRLLKFPGEFVFCNSFLPESETSALARVQKHRVKMRNADSKAASLIQALSECEDAIASDHLRLGTHHCCVLLVASTEEQLKKNVSLIFSVFNEIGCSPMIEQFAMEVAFWGMMPGNTEYRLRTAHITSQNYVDFTALHNYSQGKLNCNHLGSAVTVLETCGGTPYFFHFHQPAQSSINEITPGHSTIIGGNGSGKTVLMAFLDAQMGRYQGRSIFFDRDSSSEIYIKACGGGYYHLSPEASHTFCLNPFSLNDTPDNRTFVKKWLWHLALEPGEEHLPSVLRKPLDACVDYAFDCLPLESRYLSNALMLLPVNYSRWAALSSWLVRTKEGSIGAYSYLFDRAGKRLSWNYHKIGFDFTHLLQQPGYVVTAVTMYLMHELRQSLSGERVSVYMDEGWQLLNHPYWVAQLKADLATFRKKNAHIVLATQSPSSILESSIKSQFLDNCATHVFFCNSKARYKDQYEAFGLSEREFSLIKHTAISERLFLYKQSEKSALLRLDLGNLPQVLSVLSGNTKSLSNMKKAIRKKGESPQYWLPEYFSIEGVSGA